MVKKEFSDTSNLSTDWSGSQQNTCIPLGVRHAHFERIPHGVTSNVEVKRFKRNDMNCIHFNEKSKKSQ